MTRTVVLAFGGNALIPEGGTGSYRDQLKRCRAMAAAAGELICRGDRLVLSHGNGPHVGNLAIQQDNATDLVAGQPLHSLVAMTQGQIGDLVALSLQNLLIQLRGQIVGLVTHVMVDPDDPEFSAPTKPVGPFFSHEEGQRLAAERHWTMAESSPGTVRRVVPSPTPISIVEMPSIRSLVDAGATVIAAGGGGVPVIEGPDGSLTATDAVIDKDLTAARLACALDADHLAMLTSVSEVALDFGTPDQRGVQEMTATEALAHHAEGQFPAGSMGPKVTAAVDFLHGGGQLAVITDAEHLGAALSGDHGTRIVPDPPSTKVDRQNRPEQS